MFMVRVEDQRSGIAVFPAEYAGVQPARILDPAGYHLHMTNADHPGEELVYPAGTLIDPPEGRFRTWLQGEWSITPFSDLSSFASARRPGSKSIRTSPVIPAGRVTVTADRKVAPDLQLRLLYLGGDPVAGLLRHELSRRAAVADLGEGLLMPEGPVLAGLWDQRSESYVALSPPFAVRARQTVEAPLAPPPRDSAHLIVYLERARGTRTESIGDLVLIARQQSGEYRPQVAVPTAWGVYAVWYDLDPGPVGLKAANDQMWLDAEPFELKRGQITRFQRQLSRGLF
jgi:hypothetical protein